jgi:hypothetical protein
MFKPPLGSVIKSARGADVARSVAHCTGLIGQRKRFVRAVWQFSRSQKMLARRGYGQLFHVK